MPRLAFSMSTVFSGARATQDYFPTQENTVAGKMS